MFRTKLNVLYSLYMIYDINNQKYPVHSVIEKTHLNKVKIKNKYNLF